MEKMNLKFALAAACLMTTTLADAQMLKVVFNDFEANDDNVGVYYSPEGSLMATKSAKMTWNADGSLSCDVEETDRNTDVIIYVGKDLTFGAHLVPGKTSTMTLAKDKDGNLKADFEGEEKAVCYAVSKMAQTYDIQYYFPMEGAVPPFEENYAKLNKRYAESKNLIKSIKDKDVRAYYTKFNEYCYKFLVSRLKMEDLREKGGRLADDSLYQALTKDVDINDDLTINSYLSMIMIDAYHTLELPYEKDMGDYCRETMQICDKYVTNPRLRKSIVEEVGTYYFSYGKDTGNSRQFYKEACEWAGADSVYLKRYEAVLDSKEKTKAGSKAFDVTLTDAEGKSVQLLDLVKGKFAYIDVWATWCGPCKKEIPFFAKLAEKYDGKNDIMFVSISVDENVEAWKNMIGEEKPSWVQYNVNGETNKTFSEQWGITGIPRFLMIDKQGNIYNANAPRPSSQQAEEILQSIME